MAAGRAVLRVIDREGLQQNCSDVGGYLLLKLRCVGCRPGPLSGRWCFHPVCCYALPCC